ncbi:DUF998 domain-containing protein [Brevundimonas sp. 2R-24]|uniref:DUF998 domain-containing protein n=1 Tax=Peiella sedimenti TaxID=3061083 RepID=A0ABT8SKN6_9CAUL|nr:DUF998 domain-containing protein [Caulobacteraceae bacterium XZ-24]
MRFGAFLTKFAILIPLLYFGGLYIAAFAYPGFDHWTQFASDLGKADSPQAMLFNYGLIGAGGAAIVAALGFFVAMGAMSRNAMGWLFSLLGAGGLGAWGWSTILAGRYPLPDNRHVYELFVSPWGTVDLHMAILAAPLFLMLAAMSGKRMGGPAFIYFLGFVAQAALLAIIMMDVGGLATPETLGAWQRGYVAAMTLWPALAALVLGGAVTAKMRADRRRTAMSFVDDSAVVAAPAAAAAAGAAHAHGHDDHGHGDHGHADHGHDAHGHDAHGHGDHGHGDHGHADHGHADHGHDAHGHGDHGHDDHGHADHGHGDHGHGDHGHGDHGHGHDDHGHGHGHDDHGHGHGGHDDHGHGHDDHGHGHDDHHKPHH